jgi:hypothetical protein
MATNPNSPNLIETHIVEFRDGRKVRVREYDNDEIRFQIDRTPYVITEAYLSGNPDQHAIIKLSPGRRGDDVAKTSS